MDPYIALMNGALRESVKLQLELLDDNNLRTNSIINACRLLGMSVEQIDWLMTNSDTQWRFFLHSERPGSPLVWHIAFRDNETMTLAEFARTRLRIPTPVTAVNLK